MILFRKTMVCLTLPIAAIAGSCLPLLAQERTVKSSHEMGFLFRCDPDPHLNPNACFQVSVGDSANMLNRITLITNKYGEAIETATLSPRTQVTQLGIDPPTSGATATPG